MAKFNINFDGLITMDVTYDIVESGKYKEYAQEEFLKLFPEYTMTSCIVSTNDVGEKLKCLICGYEKNNKTD
jgi:hypothetical protein